MEADLAMDEESLRKLDQSASAAQSQRQLDSRRVTTLETSIAELKAELATSLEETNGLKNKNRALLQKMKDNEGAATEELQAQIQDMANELERVRL